MARPQHRPSESSPGGVDDALPPSSARPDHEGMSLSDHLVPHVEHFRYRVILDAIQEATAAYWLRRAAKFAGVGTVDCDLIARNCRHHAWLVTDIGLDAAARELIVAATAAEATP